jgi:FKBP-type peptidyl-prolyl cis-trans isomerase 2
MEAVMRKVQLDDVIRVHYTGKLEDGSEFDSSKDQEPLEFKVGEGKLIPGFEKGVVGMKQGESKTISLPPEEAYGERREELITRMDKTELPSNISPDVGMWLQMKRNDGQAIPVVVAEVTEDAITLDANPPLAGKTLIFELELVEFV